MLHAMLSHLQWLSCCLLISTHYSSFAIICMASLWANITKSAYYMASYVLPPLPPSHSILIQRYNITALLQHNRLMLTWPTCTLLDHTILNISFSSPPASLSTYRFNVHYCLAMPATLLLGDYLGGEGVQEATPLKHHNNHCPPS